MNSSYFQMVENSLFGKYSTNKPFAANDHLVQKSAMLEGKLIIIPALGHQNKGKSSFSGSGLFVLMSQ